MQFNPLPLIEHGEAISVGFREMLAYHGHQAPGGVAHATAVLHRALPALSDGPAERRELHVATSFGGGGFRDAIEMSTRAVTGDRFLVDGTMARPDRGTVLRTYVFAIGYRDRRVTLQLRDDGFVVPEFIDLAARMDRDAVAELRLRRLKLEMTQRILCRSADEVYDITDVQEG